MGVQCLHQVDPVEEESGQCSEGDQVDQTYLNTYDERDIVEWIAYDDNVGYANAGGGDDEEEEGGGGQTHAHRRHRHPHVLLVLQYEKNL